jgi:hypothetical protein
MFLLLGLLVTLYVLLKLPDALLVHLELLVIGILLQPCLNAKHALLLRRRRKLVVLFDAKVLDLCLCLNLLYF